ncbi:MAG: S8 family serine peptidase, partial [Phycisphaerales bacterium]|nr:S8 family serine peptidase [Phycisphaerales bacterium]
MRVTHMLRGASVVALCAGFAFGQQAMTETEARDVLARGKAALEQDPSLAFMPNQVLVRFTRDEAPLRQAALDIVGGRLIRTLKGTDVQHLEVAMPVDEAVKLLSALPFVDYAEPDYVVRADASSNDTYIGLQWGLNNTGQDIRGVLGTPDADIDGFEAWDVRTNASGVVVAIIDSGTQWDHPDLDGNIWSNSDEIAGNGVDDDGNGFVDDTRGWDFYSNDNNPDDGDGHGTHTAGTVGAEGNNGAGVAGVCWDVQLMPLRFLGPFGGSTSDAVEAVNYAVANGARISNNSWGGGGFSTSLYNAIANAGSQNHLFVAAAGNDGVNTDNSAHYPSSYDLGNIISVAATDNRDGRASFSNYGSTTVDLGAPGVDIASTY